jgi:hypothetical protein
MKNVVATTWFISFEQIRYYNPLTTDYLSFMAYVDTKDIPQSLLPPGQSRKKETEVIGTLQGYSFVTIHQLVHSAMRNWLRKEGLLPDWTCRAIVRLTEVLGYIGHDNRVTWGSYMPHAYYVLRSRLTGEDDDYRLDLLWKYGLYLYYDARYREAEILFERAMETLQDEA